MQTKISDIEKKPTTATYIKEAIKREQEKIEWLKSLPYTHPKYTVLGCVSRIRILKIRLEDEEKWDLRKDIK